MKNWVAEGITSDVNDFTAHKTNHEWNRSFLAQYLNGKVEQSNSEALSGYRDNGKLST